MSHASSDPGTDADGERAQLRTIGFRMREIQRLLSMRVEQENRRLEADGLDPVTEPRFRDSPPAEG